LTTCSDVAALGPISPITSCACQRMGRRVIKSCTSVYEYDGSMADGRRGPAGTHLVGADGDVGAVKEVRGSTALTLHGSSPVIVCPPGPHLPPLPAGTLLSFSSPRAAGDAIATSSRPLAPMGQVAWPVW
jgi:hypothetical protein